MWNRFIDFASSLKLTLICLSAASVLVFAGTLAQVHYGTYIVQERFFQSLFVWWPQEPGAGFRLPVFPGGHLLGAILLINLIAAHIRRFTWKVKKLGIYLTHAGLIIMLAGGLFTDLFAVDSHMRLAMGETKNYCEDQRAVELAVTDQRNSEYDQVTAISESRLRKGGTIEHSSLPFRILVKYYYENSNLKMLDKASSAEPSAEQGIGARVSVKELPRVTAADQNDVKSAVIQIVPIPTGNEIAATPLGTWLVSDVLEGPQTFSYAGGTWQLALRLVRYYKPYSVTLQKFTHEQYLGTDIPKNFASSITLIDQDNSVNRDVLIYMNHPLRYSGDTFYQSGFEPNDKATILQVVRNPTFVAPYIACIIIGVGLMIQFSYHLVGFARRRKTAQPA